LIVTILTDLFGVQSYLVNGVRASTKKGAGAANLFQPAAILDLIVYHNELRNLQRISEFKWGYLYKNIFSDIKKNAVSLFMVELLTKCLKQPEANEDLFLFVEDALLHLDEGSETVMANFPLFFSLHMAVFFGFQIDDQYSEKTPFLDLQEGVFVKKMPSHPHFLEEKQAAITSQLLKVMQPYELEEFNLNYNTRRQLLLHYQDYYALHIPEFGQMKTLMVLHEVL